MRQLPDTRASLIFRLQDAGEDTAWEDFCGVYEGAVHGYARKKGLGEADARDLTQDVLTAVFESVGRWQSDGQPASFRRWLFRIAHNAVVNSLVRRARGVHATGETWERLQLAGVPSPTATDQTAFDLEFRREAFRWAADRVEFAVSETTWKAFLRTALEGEPAEVVASDLGMTVGGVYTAKCRVLARLKREVEAFLRQHEDETCRQT
jgi:RNA polymerase sigma-70 factor (ECF subfamily)